LKKDVNLLRDARIVEVNEAEDMMVVVFEDRDADTSGRITLFMALKPALQIKAWITNPDPLTEKLATKPKIKMKKYTLPDAELDALVAYVASLKK